jgi:hypothetical protein
MKTVWNYDQCLSVLNKEIDLLKRISCVQNTVRKAVMEREWADFDWKIAQINQFGVEFGELDAERAGLFAALAAGKAANLGPLPPFYALAAKLPENQRRELTGLYRTLKIETIKMRAMNETFLDYLNEAKTTAAAYMDAVFPARGGKVYTRKGGEAARELTSIVLNSHI